MNRSRAEKLRIRQAGLPALRKRHLRAVGVQYLCCGQWKHAGTLLRHLRNVHGLGLEAAHTLRAAAALEPQAPGITQTVMLSCCLRCEAIVVPGKPYNPCEWCATHLEKNGQDCIEDLGLYRSALG